MIDTIKNLDDIEKVRLKITFFLIFISSIIVFILSFSIYLVYENQKYVEIEDKLKSTLFEILPNLDDNLKNVMNTQLKEGSFFCIYNMENKKKFCLNNLNGKSLNFSNFDKEKISLKTGTNVQGNFYILSYLYKSQNEYYIVIGYDISKINQDLKKLRNSIILSSLAVIFLSGFLAFSVSGRLLKPIKEQKDSLEHTLSIVSHDLKTPISIINTNLYLMKYKNFQNVENHLDQIEKNLEYMKNITSNIDALKSISKEDIEEVNIKDIIENIINKFQTKIKEKNISVKINQKDNLIVNANKTDMEVCFSNLIDNAIKYNVKNGFIKIDILKNSVEISNTGKKIENLKKVFEKFYREDKSGTTEGLGLGLSIVYKICKKYGFKIKVNTTEDMNVFSIHFN
ncbi:HAMP domain-containing sensor histidine kinase [Sulfurihydrogenibium sp.]|uniref:sensor histidine kinase n=1 Tax=Sulfurihydrogenibium sp. TaxID=2053621 RepID=UPI0026288911|nr:HAMP domain-containing sensor histidine kinase [Sulfurihydrogenibium sp.]